MSNLERCWRFSLNSILTIFFSFGTLSWLSALPQEQKLQETRGAVLETQEPTEFQIGYSCRHALIIGIDKYEDPGYPDLGYAVADAQAVANVLVDRFGFVQKDVKLLLNEAATKTSLDKALEDWACHQNRVGEDDLMVIYFAGHGVTRDLGSRGSRGYLVPVDGYSDTQGSPIWSTMVGMNDLEDVSEAIPAKHALFILDCCFGGLALSRAAPPVVPGLLNRARQVITAGNAEQTVLDVWGGNHSVFTGALLKGLLGEADLDEDKVFTFGELYSYVGREVEFKTEKRQTPLQATFIDHEGGNVALYSSDVFENNKSLLERYKELELKAKIQHDSSECLRLAARSALMLQDDPTLALLLAIESAKIKLCFESNKALSDAISNCHKCKIFNHDTFVNSACFSPNNMSIITISMDNTARVFDIADETEKYRFIHYSPVRQVKYSNNGDQIYTYPEIGDAKTWDAFTGDLLLNHRPDDTIITTMRKHAINIIDGNNLQVIDDANNNIIFNLNESSDIINDAVVSDNLSFIAIAFQNNVVSVWDLSRNIIVAVFKGHKGEVTSVSFSKDSKYVLTASKDKTVRIWEIDKYDNNLYLDNQTKNFSSAMFSKDGKYIITTTGLYDSSNPTFLFDKEVRIWNSMNVDLASSISSNYYPFVSAQLSPNNKLIAAVTMNNNIIIYDKEKGIANFTIPGYHSLAFSNDSKLLLTPNLSINSVNKSSQMTKNACIWDLNRCMPSKILNHNNSILKCAIFSNDNDFIATADNKGIVKVWGTKSGDLKDEFRFNIKRYDNLINLIFSDNDTKLLIAYSYNIYQIDLNSKNIELNINQAIKRNLLVSYSLDSEYIISALSNNTIHVYDSKEGNLQRVLKGHTDEILCMKSFCSGNKIVTSSKDKTIKIWNMETEEELSTFNTSNDVIALDTGTDDNKILTLSNNGIAKIINIDLLNISNILKSRELTDYERDKYKVSNYINKSEDLMNNKKIIKPIINSEPLPTLEDIKLYEKEYYKQYSEDIPNWNFIEAGIYVDNENDNEIQILSLGIASSNEDPVLRWINAKLFAHLKIKIVLIENIKIIRNILMNNINKLYGDTASLQLNDKKIENISDTIMKGRIVINKYLTRDMKKASILMKLVINEKALNIIKNRIMEEIAKNTRMNNYTDEYTIILNKTIELYETEIKKSPPIPFNYR